MMSVAESVIGMFFVKQLEAKKKSNLLSIWSLRKKIAFLFSYKAYGRG